MKLLSVLSTLAVVILLSSCDPKQSGNEAKNTVNPDSLAEVWTKAWIAHDSASIASMLTEKTQIIFASDAVLTGRDSIIAKWVSPYLLSTGNITTTKLASGASDGMAYFAAAYSREMIENDSVTGSDKSTYMAVWKLHDDNSWKLETMHFGSAE